jgi:hypothetical protein
MKSVLLSSKYCYSCQICMAPDRAQSSLPKEYSRDSRAQNARYGTTPVPIVQNAENDTYSKYANRLASGKSIVAN